MNELNLYPVVCQQPPNDTCANLLKMATMGAVMGGAAAAARNIAQVRNNQLDARQALLDTGKVAAATSLAAAVAGAVSTSVTDQGLLRLGVMFAAGTVTLYGIQQWMGSDDVEQP